MTAIQIIITILLVLLIAASIWLAFMYGYDKGVHDLTKEIDEGLQKIREKHKTVYDEDGNAYIKFDGFNENNDSD